MHFFCHNNDSKHHALICFTYEYRPRFARCRWTRILYAGIVIFDLLVIFVSVFNSRIAGLMIEDENPPNEHLFHFVGVTNTTEMKEISESYKSPVFWVLILTVFSAFLRGMSRLLKCETKWRHFRYHSMILEGKIWRYRTRVGKFAVSLVDKGRPLRVFAEELHVRLLLLWMHNTLGAWGIVPRSR